MNTGQLLNQIREYYLTRLDQAACKQRAEADSVVLEPALRNQQGAVVREGPFGLPFRQDLMAISGGRVVDSVQLDTKCPSRCPSRDCPQWLLLVGSAKPRTWAEGGALERPDLCNFQPRLRQVLVDG